jgi:hypothetical protein
MQVCLKIHARAYRRDLISQGSCVCVTTQADMQASFLTGRRSLIIEGTVLLVLLILSPPQLIAQALASLMHTA